MCKAGRCGAYGKCWTCPPYCGTLEESTEKAKQFNTGILLQMTGQMLSSPIIFIYSYLFNNNTKEPGLGIYYSNKEK